MCLGEWFVEMPMARGESRENLSKRLLISNSVQVGPRQSLNSKGLARAAPRLL